MKILVVDDNRDLADTLKLFFDRVGHEVTVAYDAFRAVGLAAQMRPDIVFLDINMPDVNGYALARFMREILPEGVYLIAHSARSALVDVDRARQAGFDEYLLKPVDGNDLLTVVEERQVKAPLSATA